MIRKATVNDIAGLSNLLLQVQALHARGRTDIFKLGGIKYTKPQIKDIIENENTPVYVFINEQGSLVGYAFCEFKTTKESTSLKERKTFYIEDLCVDSSARRQNIGKSLYDFVLEVAKKENCDSVTLNVWELNAGAKAFYEKCGMKPLKTVMEQIL